MEKFSTIKTMKNLFLLPLMSLSLFQCESKIPLHVPNLKNNVNLDSIVANTFVSSETSITQTEFEIQYSKFSKDLEFSKDSYIKEFCSELNLSNCIIKDGDRYSIRKEIINRINENQRQLLATKLQIYLDKKGNIIYSTFNCDDFPSLFDVIKILNQKGQ
jgi:hypothetical protein